MRAYRRHGTRSPLRGVTLVEIMIFMAVLVGLVGLAACLGPGCSDIVYPRDVSGTVVATGSRMAPAGKGSMEEKFALQLKDVTRADSVVRAAAREADGTYMVECLSTRCALLRPDQCVDLECNREVRWTEPNVVQCKLKAVVACPSPGAQPGR